MREQLRENPQVVADLLSTMPSGENPQNQPWATYVFLLLRSDPDLLVDAILQNPALKSIQRSVLTELGNLAPNEGVRLLKETEDTPPLRDALLYGWLRNEPLDAMRCAKEHAWPLSSEQISAAMASVIRRQPSRLLSRDLVDALNGFKIDADAIDKELASDRPSFPPNAAVLNWSRALEIALGKTQGLQIREEDAAFLLKISTPACLQGLTNLLAQLDKSTLKSILSTTNNELLSKLQPYLAEELFTLRGIEAFDLIDEIATTLAPIENLSTEISKAYASVDPLGALAYAQNQSSHRGETLLSESLKQLAQIKPDETFSRLLHNQKSPVHSVEAVQSVIAIMPEIAVKHFDEIQNLYPEATDRWPDLLFRSWASKDPESAIRWAMSADAQIDSYPQAFNLWATQEPNTLSEYILNSPSGPLREIALEALIQSLKDTDPAAAAAWKTFSD